MDFRNFPLIDQGVLNAIRRRVRLHRLSLHQVSKQTGISYSWLRHFLAGHNEAAFERLAALIVMLRQLDDELESDIQEGGK